jgi:metal-sulfur cluster biosynthetic enzyme
MTTTAATVDPRVSRTWEALHEVIDPELGLDVVDLGLVYDVTIDDAGWVRVTMTLTTPGCPVSESLPGEAETAVCWALGPSTPVTVEVVWDPQWTPERISDAAAERLGYRRRGA